VESTRLELYAFAYFDAITQKWHRARYVATIDAIGTRYGPFPLLGKPEVREVSSDPADWLPPQRRPPAG
jgi:hypothetical protein